jgi:hypothetical protein
MLQNYIRSVIISYAQKEVTLEKFKELILVYVQQKIEEQYGILQKEGIVGIKDNKLVYLKED